MHYHSPAIPGRGPGTRIPLAGCLPMPRRRCFLDRLSCLQLWRFFTRCCFRTRVLLEGRGAGAGGGPCPLQGAGRVSTATLQQRTHHPPACLDDVRRPWPDVGHSILAISQPGRAEGGEGRQLPGTVTTACPSRRRMARVALTESPFWKMSTATAMPTSARTSSTG